MNKILCLLLFFFPFNSFTQNLVSNPSYEQYSFCPNYMDQLLYCQNWFVCRETPDYYNSCSSFLDIVPPNCSAGYQYSHSGNAFLGLITFTPIPQNNREFIGSQLVSSFVINQKYFFSFYVNLSGGINLGTTIASNKIGIKFSTIPYSYSNPAPINNTAHFYTNTIITDTAKWTRISGSFIADSAYSYILLGNFFDDAHTDTLNLSPTNNNYAYYYIDDVCVSPDSLFCENWLGVSEQTVKNTEDITIYPNPWVNHLNVKFNNIPSENTTLSVLDITGKVILQTITKENEFVINTEKLAKGLYLVKVENGKTVALKKITK
ncbi:MAG: T9SS type A sorting domain-containing protein [Bacteroidia bacterium]|nr:T9SS type A sorting domain-containing protein [Bacteroidia bacterium]